MEYITVVEFAEKMGITRQCVRSLIRHGSLKAKPIGTRRNSNGQSPVQYLIPATEASKWRSDPSKKAYKLSRKK